MAVTLSLRKPLKGDKYSVEGDREGVGVAPPRPQGLACCCFGLLWAALACFGLLWAAFKDLIENLTFQRISMKSLTFHKDLLKNRIFQRICMNSFTFDKDLLKNRRFQRICLKSFTFN